MYKWAKKSIVPLLKAYHRIEVVHSNHIPEKEGYIIVANHQSFLDPFYVGAVLPHQPFFMAKQEAFDHWILGRILRAFEAFPVKRDENDLKAMKHAIRLLNENKVLGIFPEGGRRKEKDFEALKLGASFFSKKTNKVIVPIYIYGADKALPSGNGWPKPVKIKLYFGENLNPEEFESYQELGEQVHKSLIQLKIEAEQENT